MQGYQTPTKSLAPYNNKVPESLVKGAVELDKQIGEYLEKRFLFPAEPRLQSCYVQYNKSTDNLENFISNVVRDLQLPPVDEHDSYSLVMDNAEYFLNQENMNKLKQGFILTLTASPKNYACKLMKTLDENSTYEQIILKTLEKLEKMACDALFFKELERVNGIKKLIEYIEVGKFNKNGTALTHLYNIFLTLMHTNDGINVMSEESYWETLSNEFVTAVASHICEKSKIETNESLIGALDIVEGILLRCGTTQLNQLKKKVPFEALIRHLEKTDKRIVIKILNLMYALYKVGDEGLKITILKDMQSHTFRNTIMKILKQYSDLNKIEEDLVGALLQLKEVTVVELAKKCSHSPPIEQIMQIQQMPSLNPIVHPQLLYTTGSAITTNFGANEDDISTSSGTDGLDYLDIDWNSFAEVVTQKPPGLLALDSILYFENNYSSLLQEINSENLIWQGTSSWPFPIVAAHLVTILVEIFEIPILDLVNGSLIKSSVSLKRVSTLSGESSETTKPKSRLFFLFLTVGSVFHEVFTLSIRLFRRTWREMHASNKDVSKVLKVVKDQLSRALINENPLTIIELDNILQKYSYYQMQKIWEKERFERDQSELQSDAIRQLKPHLRIKYEALVQQNRRNCMKKGFVFTKVPKEKTGIKSGNVATLWLWKLDKNERFLWYQDVTNDKVKNLDMSQAQKVGIEEIGDCRFDTAYVKYMSEIYGSKAKKIPNNGIAIFKQSSIEPEFNLATDDLKTLGVWQDGITSLLRNKLWTTQAIDHVEKLLRFDVNVRLMDIDCLPEIKECEIGVFVQRKVPDLPTDFSWIPPTDKLS
uniref:ELMO domain-containing protein n=1 Tax=Rhabditophanes sp. KR3021 TaxID=114890 RepID=A0AC35TMB7_9BILA